VTPGGVVELWGPGGWLLPTGRISRSDWWLGYVLVVLLLGVLASVVDARWFPDAHPRFEDTAGAPDVADVLWFFPDQAARSPRWSRWC
jgi:hypothetical protein